MGYIMNMVTGKSRAKSSPLFTVSNNKYTYKESVASDGTVNWELALTEGSGTLTFQRVVDTVDVFLCGGGKTGADRNGGKGGQCVTCSGTGAIAVTANTAYSFTVGASDQATTIFGKTASSGGGANGGAGAVLSTQTAAQAGSDGSYAFGSSSTLINAGRKYGAGGGGGCYCQGGFAAYGASGGAYGGGHGADPERDTEAKASGLANSGGGGGGNGWHADWNKSYPAGKGGSGIIIIRNHRT